MWYVVQVLTGQEESTCRLIEQRVSAACCKECFVPKYQLPKKVGGVWETRTKPLFPGYVIVDTPKVADLEAQLRRVPAFTKVLTADGEFIPLAQGEVAWICAFTQKRRRIIPPSKGVIEGDKIVITEGPLIGKSGWIKKINRPKRLAFLEMQMCGRTVRAKVGLEIVAKQAGTTE